RDVAHGRHPGDDRARSDRDREPVQRPVGRVPDTSPALARVLLGRRDDARHRLDRGRRPAHAGVGGAAHAVGTSAACGARRRGRGGVAREERLRVQAAGARPRRCARGRGGALLRLGVLLLQPGRLRAAADVLRLDDPPARRPRPRVGRSGRGGGVRLHLRRYALPEFRAVHVGRLRRAGLHPPDHHRADHPRARRAEAAGPARQPTGDGARVSPILEVEDVVRTFGAVRAVDSATFAVEEHSVTGLIGPNGAGKSTLFATIAGSLKPTSGRIVFAGRRIDRTSAYRVARAGVVRTYQAARVLTRMSVLDNVLLASKGHPGERVLGAVLRPGASRDHERAARARAHELLALVGLEAHTQAYAGTLSGGQRTLLDLARVLMLEPSL